LEKIEKQRRAEGWYNDPIPEPIGKTKVVFMEQSTIG